MKIASEKDIEEFVSDVKTVLGDNLERAILYGSYARDEHDTGSDIDIAFIVNEEVDEDEIFKIVDEHRMEKDLAFSPRFFKSNEFESKLNEGYSFYQNVNKEGVEV